MKKRGCWVLLGVMVLVGALLLNLNLQKQSPVIPDVNAQMNNSSNAMMGSYEYNGSYSLGNIGSYGASPISFMPETEAWSPTMGDRMCSTQDTCSPFCLVIPITQKTCLSSCYGISITQKTCSSYCFGTRDTCSSSCFKMPANTWLFCPGPGGFTSLNCPSPGINTMLSCPTSTTCDIKCFNIGPQNPIAFPVDVGPWWQPGGSPIPGSIVDFPVYSTIPIGPYGIDYGFEYSQNQYSNVGQSPAM